MVHIKEYAHHQSCDFTLVCRELLGTECNPQYSNDTCTEERLLAGNLNVCTGEAEGLSCYP